MPDELPFRTVVDYPGDVTPTNVITRLLDGLGYRYYWAVEGLREQDYDFQLTPEAFSIGRNIMHIWKIVYWIELSLSGSELKSPESQFAARDRVLHDLLTVRNRFAEMSSDDLADVSINSKPFWNMISGPIADMLTHVGQISMLRRAAGNPVIKSKPFSLEEPD